MKAHKTLMAGTLACMLGATSILAMDPPAAPNTKAAQGKPAYSNEDYQKFMLLQEIVKKHEDNHGQAIPKDVTHEIAKKHAEVTMAYQEAEAIADLVRVNKYGSIKLIESNTPNNLIFQIVCKKHPEIISIDITDCTGITDLPPLQGLANLGYIDITGCTGITDLTPLQGLANLGYIDITGCTGITDLSPLQGLTNLAIIKISDCTGIRDLSPLQGLINLKYIFMNRCTGITDLSPLQDLKNLEQIYMMSCPGITDEQIKDLRVALPNLKIERQVNLGIKSAA